MLPYRFHRGDALLIEIKFGVAQHFVQLVQLFRAMRILDIDENAEAMLVINEIFQQLPPHFVVETIMAVPETLVIQSLLVGYDDRPKAKLSFGEKQIDQGLIKCLRRWRYLRPLDLPGCGDAMLRLQLFDG